GNQPQVETEPPVRWSRMIRSCAFCLSKLSFAHASKNVHRVGQARSDCDGGDRGNRRGRLRQGVVQPDREARGPVEHRHDQLPLRRQGRPAHGVRRRDRAGNRRVHAVAHRGCRRPRGGTARLRRGQRRPGRRAPRRRPGADRHRPERPRAAHRRLPAPGRVRGALPQRAGGGSLPPLRHPDRDARPDQRPGRRRGHGGRRRTRTRRARPHRPRARRPVRAGNRPQPGKRSLMMTNEKPVADTMTGEQPAPDAGLRRVVRANVITVVFEVIVPMVLFYGLRAAGVSQWWALMAGVLVAAPYVGWTIARNRRVDLVALFTLSVLVLSVVLGLLSDDPRTLAIREGWTAALGGLFGLWMLVTVVVGKPAQLTLGRTVAEVKRGAEGAAGWAARWDTDARFRRGLRVDTAVWGAVLLANAVAHVVLVYTLPIDLISLVTTVEWFASLACLITWHVWYIRKENLDA